MQRAWAGPQQGVTLLELLVASVLAALVMAAALNTLVVSKAVTATTTELAAMQQDAGFALMVMGRLIRQAGSLEPVQSISPQGLPRLSFEERRVVIVEGTPGVSQAGDRLQVGTQAGQRAGVNADCFGNAIVAREFSTVFVVNAEQQLTCQTRVEGSTGSGAQPLIDNVMAMTVQYRIAQRDAAGRESLLVSTETPPPPRSERDPRVIAIELCLELQAPTRIQAAVGDFRNCQNELVPLDQRLRRVFRQVFFVRAA